MCLPIGVSRRLTLCSKSHTDKCALLNQEHKTAQAIDFSQEENFKVDVRKKTPIHPLTTVINTCVCRHTRGWLRVIAI